MSKRIIINTLGSFGDIHPYIAIASELQARGHVPVIATSELYREKITSADLPFVAIRPNLPPPGDQAQELMDQVMEPRTGPKFLMEKIIFPALRDSYADLLPTVEQADLLVTHPAAPAGPLVAYKTGIPWISTVLTPFSFFSAYDLPVPPYWSWTAKVRLLGPRVTKVCLDIMKSAIRSREVEALRNELGIPDYGNVIAEGQHSPHRVLALFSSVFAAPQPDWPANTTVTGFPFYDGRHETPLSDELVSFLSAGEPPIIFTLGSSAVWVARNFFVQSIAAAKALGRRAVLLIGDQRNALAHVPANMIAVEYAPYQSLLPHAAAVVHHGGIGTTSQGLLAGVPTLIVPFAFDQVDNADHARRLGTSRTVYRKHYSAERAAKELEILLTEESYTERARIVSAQLKKENGVARAAAAIEEQLESTSDASEELAHAVSD